MKLLEQHPGPWTIEELTVSPPITRAITCARPTVHHVMRIGENANGKAELQFCDEYAKRAILSVSRIISKLRTIIDVYKEADHPMHLAICVLDAEEFLNELDGKAKPEMPKPLRAEVAKEVKERLNGVERRLDVAFDASGGKTDEQKTRHALENAQRAIASSRQYADDVLDEQLRMQAMDNDKTFVMDGVEYCPICNCRAEECCRVSTKRMIAKVTNGKKED